MSKELEALESIRYCFEYGDELGDVHYSEQIENLSIIETALKSYETLKADFESMRDFKYKQLDAFEIIKKKNVDILRIKITKTVQQYNKKRIKGCKKLTQEEYNLLKEELK